MPILKKHSVELDSFELDSSSRRRPGQFLREKGLSKTFTYVTLWALLTGFGVALTLSPLLVRISTNSVILWIGVLTAGLALLLLFNAVYSRSNWSLQSIQKGLAGETLIGDITERALLKSNGLFVAHDVTLSTSNANIDHVVATPTMVLVVETKYQNLSRQNFAKALQAIRSQVKRTELLLGMDSHVFGCLVIAKETKPFKKTEYDDSLTKVYVFNTQKYEEFLLQIGNGERALPDRVYAKIEELAYASSSTT